MRFIHSQRPHMLELDLTSMIDVVFLLIIFFMTTSQFVERARAELELPREPGEKEARAATPPLVINILAQGADRYIVGEKRMDEGGVKALIDREISRLRADGGSVGQFEVIIRADQRGPSLWINTLGSFLRERGVWRWRLATEPAR